MKKISPKISFDGIRALILADIQEMLNREENSRGADADIHIPYLRGKVDGMLRAFPPRRRPFSGRHVGRINGKATNLVIKCFNDEVDPAVDIDGEAPIPVESAVKRHLTVRTRIFDYVTTIRNHAVGGLRSALFGASEFQASGAGNRTAILYLLSVGAPLSVIKQYIKSQKTSQKEKQHAKGI